MNMSGQTGQMVPSVGLETVTLRLRVSVISRTLEVAYNVTKLFTWVVLYTPVVFD